MPPSRFGRDFDNSNDNVDAVLLLRPRGLKHFVGLADAGRCSDKNL